MIMSDLHPGDPLHWCEYDCELNSHVDYYAVAVKESAGAMACVPVFYIEPDTKCFDEGGSNQKDHGDNVRLKHAPPPFSELAAWSSVKGVYAFAKLDQPIRVDDNFLKTYQPDKPDNGFRVHDKDMADILDHPWNEEKSLGLGEELETGSLLELIADDAVPSYDESWNKISEPAVVTTPALEKLRALEAKRVEQERQAGPDGPGFGR